MTGPTYSTGRNIMAAVVTELNTTPPSGIPTFTPPVVFGNEAPGTILAQVVEGDESVTDIEKGANVYVNRVLSFDVEIRAWQLNDTATLRDTVDPVYVHVVKKLGGFLAGGYAIKIDEVGVSTVYDTAKRLAMLKTVHFQARYKTRADDPTQ